MGSRSASPVPRAPSPRQARSWAGAQARLSKLPWISVRDASPGAGEADRAPVAVALLSISGCCGVVPDFSVGESPPPG